VAACVTVWLHWENSGRVTKNLLLDGVNLARKPVADRLVDDAEDDSVQGATGEHQLMKALTYLYYTCVDVNLHHTAAVWTTSPAAAASVPDLINDTCCCCGAAPKLPIVATTIEMLLFESYKLI